MKVYIGKMLKKDLYHLATELNLDIEQHINEKSLQKIRKRELINLFDPINYVLTSSDPKLNKTATQQLRASLDDWDKIHLHNQRKDIYFDEKVELKCIDLNIDCVRDRDHVFELQQMSFVMENFKQKQHIQTREQLLVWDQMVQPAVKYFMNHLDNLNVTTSFINRKIKMQAIKKSIHVQESKYIGNENYEESDLLERLAHVLQEYNTVKKCECNKMDDSGAVLSRNIRNWVKTKGIIILDKLDLENNKALSVLKQKKVIDAALLSNIHKEARFLGFMDGLREELHNYLDKV
jgi:hypothetical protein